MAQPVSRRCQVLVVGGGPAGLAAAHCLGAWGIDVVVVEQRRTPPTHPRATMVNTRTTEILRLLGLSDPVLTESTSLESSPRVTFLAKLAGPEIGRIEIVSSTDKLMTLARQSPTLPVICPQRRLQQVMARSLGPTVELLTGHTVTMIEPTDGAVLGECVDGESTASYRIESEFTVLADGLHSGLREQVGIGTDTGPRLGSLLDIHFTADLQALTADRASALYWIVSPEVSGVLITVSPETGEWLLEVPLAGDATRDHRDHRELLRAAIGADVDIEIHGSRSWSMDSAIARNWTDGTNRVFTVGDSAHTFAPTGGFGMNTGIQDAHNLAWKIAGVLHGWASPSVLSSYEAERRPVAEFNAKQSAANANDMWTLLSRAVTPMSGTNRHADVAATLADEIECQRAHFDFSGQALGFRYGSEPVVGDVVDYSPVVAPGARAPHFWLDSPQGRVSTLDLTATTFGLFTGCAAATEWAAAAGYVKVVGAVPLAHYAVDSRYRSGIGTHSDPTGAMTAAYGIGGRATVLVRPDGHTCAVLPGDDPHHELIDAVTQFTASGFGAKEVLPQ